MRTFVALPLPAAWVAAIDEARRILLPESSGGLEKRLAPFRAAKWVAPGGLHLTLAFLGELEEALAAPLADSLEARAGGVGCFPWRICGCGTFSGRGAPARSRERGARVLWCAVEGGDSLPLLAGNVAQACDEVAPGVRDQRVFRPHVTLARCDPPWPASAVARFEERFAALDAGWSTAREAVFFRSELRSSGAIHTPLRRLRLREVPA
jgi:2'-5' RNA ligase